MSNFKNMNAKIIDVINITKAGPTITTHCENFLIGIEGHSIFKYNFKTKYKSRIAGRVDIEGYENGTRHESLFNYPKGLVFSKDYKTLYISDSCNSVIRAICIQTGITTTFSGQYNTTQSINGTKENACFLFPSVLKITPNGHTLHVSDFNSIRSIDIDTGQVSTVYKQDDIFNIRDFELSLPGYLFLVYNKAILKINISTEISEIIYGQFFHNVILSENHQWLYILNICKKHIHVQHIASGDITFIKLIHRIDHISLSKYNNVIYANEVNNNNIICIDNSKHFINSQIFIKLQLSRHSFLSQHFINYL